LFASPGRQFGNAWAHKRSESDRQHRPPVCSTRIAWAGYWVFPSPTLSVDPRSGIERRHHLYEQRLQRALQNAVRDFFAHQPVNAGIIKKKAPHKVRRF
jgi:hypothetical protein